VGCKKYFIGILCGFLLKGTKNDSMCCSDKFLPVGVVFCWGALQRMIAVLTMMSIYLLAMWWIDRRRNQRIKREVRFLRSCVKSASSYWLFDEGDNK